MAINDFRKWLEEDDEDEKEKVSSNSLSTEQSTESQEGGTFESFNAWLNTAEEDTSYQEKMEESVKPTEEVEKPIEEKPKKNLFETISSVWRRLTNKGNKTEDLPEGEKEVALEENKKLMEGITEGELQNASILGYETQKKRIGEDIAYYSDLLKKLELVEKDRREYKSHRLEDGTIVYYRDGGNGTEIPAPEVEEIRKLLVLGDDVASEEEVRRIPLDVVLNRVGASQIKENLEKLYIYERNIREITKQQEVETGIFTLMADQIRTGQWKPISEDMEQGQEEGLYNSARKKLEGGMDYSDLSMNERMAYNEVISRGLEADIDRGGITEAVGSLVPSARVMAERGIFNLITLGGGSIPVVGDLAQAITFGSGRTLKDFNEMRNTQYDIYVTESGVGFIRTGEALSEGEALARAVGGQTLQNFIENQIGKYIAKGAGKIFTKVGNTKAVTGVLKQLESNQFGKALTNSIKILKGNKVLQKIAQEVGWDGFIGESAEEGLQDISDHVVKGTDLNIFNPEWWKQVGLSVGIMSLLGLSARAGVNTVSTVKQRKTIDYINKNKEQAGLEENQKLTYDGKIIDEVSGDVIRDFVEEKNQQELEQDVAIPDEEIEQDTPVVDVEEEMLKADIAQAEEKIATEPVQEVKIQEAETKTDYSEDAQVQEVLRDISLVLDAGARKKVVSKVEGSESMGYDTQDYTYGVEGMVIPEFIPEELRSRKIVEKAYDAFLNNTIPQEGTKAWQVYQAILEESRGREGLEMQEAKPKAKETPVKKDSSKLNATEIGSVPLENLQKGLDALGRPLETIKTAEDVTDALSGKQGKIINKELTVYRVVPKGHGINRGDLVFDNIGDAKDFLANYGINRGQTEIVNAKAKLSELGLFKNSEGEVARGELIYLKETHPKTQKEKVKEEPIPRSLEDLAIEAKDMSKEDFTKEYGYLFEDMDNVNVPEGMYYKGTAENFYKTSQSFVKPDRSIPKKEYDAITDDDLPFRQRELKILEDKFLDKLTIERMKEFSMEWFGDENVEVVKNILRNKKALGVYLNRLIEIKSGQAHIGSTFYHEAIHKAFDIFLTADEKSAMIKEVVKRVGKENLVKEWNGRTSEDKLRLASYWSSALASYELNLPSVRRAGVGVEDIAKRSPEWSGKENLLLSYAESVGIKPENLYGSSVQYVDAKTGERVIYLVDGEMDAVHAQSLIDGSQFGLAGEQVDGKTWHITALKPADFENPYTIVEGKFDPRALPYSKNASQRSKQREYRNQFGITKNAKGMYRGVDSQVASVDAMAEEWLAENIIDYVNNRNSTTFWGKLKRMVDVFVDRMFRGIDHIKDIEDFYESLLSGRLLEREQRLEAKQQKNWNKYLASIQGAGTKTDQLLPDGRVNPEYRQEKRRMFRTQVGGVLQPLVTLHNISAENLLLAQFDGKLPAPSLAVTKPENPIRGFGEITLVGGREIIDPEVDRDNRLYSHDIYSPRVPAPEYDLNKKQWQKFYFNDKAVQEMFDKVDDYMYDLQDAIQHGDAKGELFYKAKRSHAMKALYLEERGIKVPIIYKPLHIPYQEYVETETFKKNKDFLMQEVAEGDEKVMKQKKAIVQQMVEEEANKNTRLDTKYMKQVYVEYDNDVQLEHFLYGLYRSLRELEKNKTGEEVDKYATKEAIEKKVQEIDDGTFDRYEAWIERYFDGMFSEPYIKISGKKEPYTTENKVRAMFGKGIKGQEGSIFGGINLIKAKGAKQYKSIAQAKRDSYGRLVSEAEYDEITSKQYNSFAKQAQKLEQYNKFSTKDYKGEFEFDYRGSEHLEYAMGDYAKGSRTMASFISAFRNNGYEFDSVTDEYLVEKTKKWADRLLSAPVPYLEAKPRRAVALNEFSGAILPEYYRKDTNKKIHDRLLSILAENGINKIFYVSDDSMNEKSKIINEQFEDVKYRMGDNPSPEAMALEQESAVSVKLPELITMATELGANIKLQKKFRGRAKLGDFTPSANTDSRIRILRELFEPQGEEVMDGEGNVEKLPETPEQQMERIHGIEKVLAHEIGHLFDWFGGTENMTLKRGNILGRIANLRNYTEGQFMDMSNKDIRKELKALTQIWNPFDEASVPKKYKTYRYSAKELYAEALSVFLNKPSLVKEVAPNFYQGFIEYMARKKEVQSEYFAIRDMIKQGNEVQSRVENMKKAQEIARGKRMTIDEEKEAYKKQSKWQEAITGIKMGFVNQYAPYLDKMRKAWKDKKITLSKLEEAEQLMGDLALKGNDAVKYAQDVQNEFFIPVSEAGIDLDTVGQILVLERNLGDRKDLANPHGLVYDYAKETYDYVKGQLTPAQWNLLTEKLSWWRDYNFDLVKKGYEAGVYSEQFFNEIATVNKNTYTPFAVVDYIEDNYVTAGVIQAVGTTKGVENPLTTQMLKSLSLMKLTATNGAKQDVVNSLAEIFPDEIVKAEAIKDGEGRTVGFKKNPKLERSGYTQLELLEDGKRSAYYMDKYIVAMFESSMNGALWDVARFVTVPFRMVNRIFKPAVTVMKASFQFYSNPLKDYQRSLTNLTALSGLFDKSNVASRTGKVFTAFTKEWVKNLKRSWNYAGGEIDAVTQKMLDMYVLSSNVKYEDIDIGNEKFKFDPVKNRIVYKGGVNWLETLRDWGSTIPVIKHTLVPVYDFYMRAGSTFEVNSKIAGFQYLSDKVGDEKASFYTRRYVGTPDYMQKGKFTPLTNELVVFSNVGIQAITADMDLATRPKTASGYWVSTMFKIVFPKLLMLLGASILRVPIPDPDDPEKKKWVNPYDYLSEYYKSMYMAFPIGYDEESESFMFVKAPSDEVGAVIGNLVWKMATYLQGEGMKVEQLGSAIAGLVPFTTGDNPLLSIMRDWKQYLQGRNPYDDFRGRLAINTTKWDEGGMTRFTEMLKWTTNELGLTNFSTYDKSSDTTLEKVMNLPLLERMFELTNYGLQEREEWEKAVGKQERNKVLDGYIESYYAEPSNKKLLELQEKYVIEVKGERPEGGWSGTEKAEETRLKSEFKREILANSGNAVYKSIAKAGLDNDEKLEIINSQKKKMSDEEFKDFMAQAVRYEVVKGEMFAEYAKDKNLSQDLIYKVVKESIPVLSQDSNNDLLNELRKRDAMDNDTLRKLFKDRLITQAGFQKYIAITQASYDKRYGEKEDDDNKTKLF